MTVYADSLFLVNFISEYLLLMLTEKITAVKMHKYRKGVAAFAGSLISVIIFCMNISHFICIVLKTVNILLIICISYPKNRTAVIRAVPVFIIVSFLYSGIISAMAGMISSVSVIKNGITYISVNEALFAALFICTYPVVLLAAKLMRRGKSGRIYHISVSSGEKSVILSSLYDSGNLLKENGKSVIIAEWDIIKTFFEPENYEDLYLHMDELNLRLLPYSTIGGSRTVIMFYADSITVRENNTSFKNVPIGILNSRISKNGLYNSLTGKEYI